jgi:hypothetical protein
MRGGFFALALSCVLAFTASAEAQTRKRRGSDKPANREPAADTATPAPTTDPAAEPAPPASASPGAAPAAVEPSPLSVTPAAPAAEPAPAAAAQTPANAPDPADEAAAQDAQAVREELSTVMDSLVSARARAALLGKSLFKTRVRVQLENEAADDQVLGKVALSLDGNPIYRGDGSTLNPEGAKLFEGYAAPGPHVLTVEIEQRAREDDGYRYSQTSSLRFVVPRGTLTDLTLVLDDDSDIAEDFKDDDEGEYDVRLRLEVVARPLGGS